MHERGELVGERDRREGMRRGLTDEFHLTREGVSGGQEGLGGAHADENAFASGLGKL